MSSTPPGKHIPFVEAAPYPPRASNLLRPLIGARAAFARIHEAIESASASIWFTGAFYDDSFCFTEQSGALFDVLDRAARRGLDVRGIFWRPNAESAGYGRTFAGTPEDHALLQRRDAGLLARWDRAAGPYCQHQKSWLIDAGRQSETAFVGSANLTARAFSHYDLYLELSGPSASDVHHNFAQRWNEASERARPDGTWGDGAQEHMAFPARASPGRGDAVVQVQRTIHPGLYTDGHASPDATPYPIAEGEWTVLRQYKQAIDAARHCIQIENQAIPVPEVTERLDMALARGIEVVLLVPGEPEAWVRSARQSAERRPHFEALARLGRYPNFSLAGLAGSDGRGSTYVHAKAMLVDDAWATIGSCNLHPFSLYGHGEMNASFRDPALVRGLRIDLLSRHLGIDTSALDGCAALRRFGEVARANRRRRETGESIGRASAFALDPATYGA